MKSLIFKHGTLGLILSHEVFHQPTYFCLTNLIEKTEESLRRAHANSRNIGRMCRAFGEVLKKNSNAH